MVLDKIVARGRVDVAARFAEENVTGPIPPVLHAWRSILRHLPEASPATFSDDLGKDVQVVRAGTGGSARSPVLLVFCGMAHRFWVPLNLIHIWLSRLGVHIVYLRDFRRIFYLRGIRSLGADYATSVAALAKLIEDLGESSVHCIGSSSGSFGALQMGLDLGAQSVLCLAGPTQTRRCRTVYPKHATPGNSGQHGPRRGNARSPQPL